MYSYTEYICYLLLQIVSETKALGRATIINATVSCNNDQNFLSCE